MSDNTLTDSIDRARRILRSIIGKRLAGARNIFATRNFYFGSSMPGPGKGDIFTMSIECPWRVIFDRRIVVGAEDYYEKADTNEDPDWEPGSPAGHLQDQLLAELLGSLEQGDVISSGKSFTVLSIDLDEYGSLRIELEGDCILEIAPTSSRRTEWVFISPTGGSLVLMNGRLHETGAIAALIDR